MDIEQPREPPCEGPAGGHSDGGHGSTPEHNTEPIEEPIIYNVELPYLSAQLDDLDMPMDVQIDTGMLDMEAIEDYEVSASLDEERASIHTGRYSTSNPLQLRLSEKRGSNKPPPNYEPPNRDLALAYFDDHRPKRIKDARQPTGSRRAKQV